MPSRRCPELPWGAVFPGVLLRLMLASRSGWPWYGTCVRSVWPRSGLVLLLLSIKPGTREPIQGVRPETFRLSQTGEGRRGPQVEVPEVDVKPGVLSEMMKTVVQQSKLREKM